MYVLVRREEMVNLKLMDTCKFMDEPRLFLFIKMNPKLIRRNSNPNKSVKGKPAAQEHKFETSAEIQNQRN
jgi:hypothetical protein